MPKPIRPPRPSTHAVTCPDAWRLLVAPARAEIVEAARLLGPCSVGEIADAIGRPADTLYHHIAMLTEAGFLRDAGARKGDRNLERLVDVVADDFVIDFPDDTGAGENRAIVDTAKSFLGAMERAVRDSAAARQLVFNSDESRNIAINYELGWLRRDDFEEVRVLIRRIKEIMDEGKARREGRLYMTVAAACPVTRKRARRAPAVVDDRPNAQAPRTRRPSKDVSEQPLARGS